MAVPRGERGSQDAELVMQADKRVSGHDAPPPWAVAGPWYSFKQPTRPNAGKRRNPQARGDVRYDAQVSAAAPSLLVRLTSERT
jgi:hypothetical protein